jgi:hypothetical protein
MKPIGARISQNLEREVTNKARPQFTLPLFT